MLNNVIKLETDSRSAAPEQLAATSPESSISTATRKSWRPSLGERMLVGFFSIVNALVSWHRLPRYLALANLAAFRIGMRQHNLHYPTIHGTLPQGEIKDVPNDALACRRSNGAYNDLRCPVMGTRATRFGRNVPLTEAHPDVPSLLLSPNPRLVSERLLARRKFEPATGLNMLAAAWIQFQIHDWFSHGDNEIERPFEIPIDNMDPWPHERPMRIQRTKQDETRTPTEIQADLPPTYTSTESHWWDASSIYSSDDAVRELYDREGGAGKLILIPQDIDSQGQPKKGGDVLLPVHEPAFLPATGFNSNWWVGLEMMHTLFAQEHNAICEALRHEYPRWDHDQLLSTARLINAALMAKIHTVEWTPAILPHPVTELALRSNWWGLAGEGGERLFSRGNEVWHGIPGSETMHHGSPFALTEEFVSVYRMHSLMPDELVFRKLGDSGWIKHVPTENVLFADSHKLFTSEDNIVAQRMRMHDIFYSFGVSHPGAITLHNFPNFLRELRVPKEVQPERRDFGPIDLGSIDILRDRERGVPRYNRMRRLMRMKPAKSFEDITDNPQWARELRAVYDDVERVDLQVGMLAEKLIPGFGFSDTAFRIFILMATRRLKSDRFFTRDFGPRIYTPLGIRWIQENDMSSVLLRHYPQLGSVLMRCKNAFKPWEPLPE